MSNHSHYKNPVGYMLDGLGSAYSYDGLNVYVSDKAVEVIPEKKKNNRKWYSDRLKAEKAKIKENIQKRSDIIDRLWIQYGPNPNKGGKL